jgi:hypothetical protein
VELVERFDAVRSEYKYHPRDVPPVPLVRVKTFLSIPSKVSVYSL